MWCKDFPGFMPNANLTGYSNIYYAMSTTFQVLTLEGWLEVMFYVQDGVGSSWWIFFAFQLFIGSILVVNMYPAVISEKLGACIALYDTQKRALRVSQEATPTQYFSAFEALKFEFQEAAHEDTHQIKKIQDVMCCGIKGEDMIPEYKACIPLTPTWNVCQKLRAYLSHELNGLSVFVYSCILLNVVILSCNGDNIPAKWEVAVVILNDLFTVIFILEAAIKLAAFGPVGYFLDPFNMFDFSLTVMGFVSIVAESLVPRFSTALRLFRIVRLSRLLRLFSMTRLASSHPADWKNASMDFPRILQVFIASAKWLICTFAVLISIMFMFAILGMDLFGPNSQVPSLLDFSDAVAYDTNKPYNQDNFGFGSLPDSFITLFTVFTGDGWNRIAQDEMNKNGPLAVLFFVCWYIISRFFILPVVIAIVFNAVNHDTIEVVKVRASSALVALHRFCFCLEKIKKKQAFMKWTEFGQSRHLNLLYNRKPVTVKTDVECQECSESNSAWMLFVQSERSWLLFDENNAVRKFCKWAEKQYWLEL